MHFSAVISVLAVLSATIAAPSPRRHQIETRTHSYPEPRQPFNPYHSEHRFAQMAENKKRASNHGRDAAPVVVVEKKAKRQIKKRGGKCAVRSASASVTAASASVASASASVSSASASEYYVASSTEAVSSAWVEPSHSASPAAASATLNVQQAAVSSVEPSAWSSSSAAPTSTVAPSTTVQATSAAPATTSAASGDWKTGGHATYFYQNGNAGACGWYKSDSDNLVAINGQMWPDSSSPSDLCGKWVNIVNAKTGATTSAMIADVCYSCTGSANSIDLSVGAFQAIAGLSEGQVDIKWKFQ